MGKGYYLGGHTIIRPGSSWFGYSKPKPRKPKRPKPKSPLQSQRVSKKELRLRAEEERQALIAAGSEARKAERAARLASPEGMAKAQALEAAEQARMERVTVERKRLPSKPNGAIGTNGGRGKRT